MQLYEAEKTLAQVPTWRLDGRSFVLSAPLDVGGVTFEGLELRGRASCALPQRDVTLQLQYHPPTGPKYLLERLDWRPLKMHNNRAKGPPAYRNRPFRDSHVHPFELNWLADFERMRVRPLAVPLDREPPSFAEFVAVAEVRFRIQSLATSLGQPSWQVDLFNVQRGFE